jgi:hypothetical protein
VLEAGEALEVVVGGADRGAVLDGQGRQVGVGVRLPAVPVAASRLRSNGQWPSPGTTARTHGWSNQDVT